MMKSAEGAPCRGPRPPFAFASPDGLLKVALHKLSCCRFPRWQSKLSLPALRSAWARIQTARRSHMGETRAHMESKIVVADALRARGLRAELEFVVDPMPGDGRAGIMVWSPNGKQTAFELQHTPIGLDEIERRAGSYTRAGIAQIWIPFIKPNIWTDGYNRSLNEFSVEKYTPRHFERGAHSLNCKKGMWV